MSEIHIAENGPYVNWIRPNLRNERGEISRTIEMFLQSEANDAAIENLTQLLEHSPFVDLSDEEWSILENTDSFEGVRPGHIEDVEAHVNASNAELEVHNRRNLYDLQKGFTEGADMEMPVILKNNEKSHLVSGNTRLMLARAYGFRPKVVMGTIETN